MILHHVVLGETNRYKLGNKSVFWLNWDFRFTQQMGLSKILRCKMNFQLNFLEIPLTPLNMDLKEPDDDLSQPWNGLAT